jgi:hypothetical protein
LGSVVVRVGGAGLVVWGVATGKQKPLANEDFEEMAGDAKLHCAESGKGLDVPEFKN